MNLLERIIGHRPPSSRDLAKERLKLVLVHDRSYMSSQMLQQLKEELVAVLSQHLDIDKDGIQITIGEGNRRNRLIADIPLMTPGRVRSRQQKV